MSSRTDNTGARRLITAREYMSHPMFTKGILDVRAGRPFCKEYETWDINAQRRYETGRQFAKVLPPDLKTRTSTGKPNPKAVRILERHVGVIL
jgi:hypothetical protein